MARVSFLESSLASANAEIARLTDLCQALKVEAEGKAAKLLADHQSTLHILLLFSHASLASKATSQVSGKSFESRGWLRRRYVRT